MNLPPLNGLKTFEVAARLSSFKAAADELCVTQAAVSRQIRQLESSMGLELFTRGHRRVELTDAGHKLYSVCHRAFDDIAAVTRDLRQSQVPAYLNLHSTSSFSRLWLVPKLTKLRQEHPDIHLHLISVEENPQVQEKFDAAVTLGLEESPDYHAQFLFGEDIFPVCTPEFLQQHPEAATLEGLQELPLLDLDPKYWRARLWSPVDWRFWLAQFDDAGQADTDRKESRAKEIKPEFYFSHFPMLIDAVLEGVGIGLGWQHLVQDMLDSGRLVRPVAEHYPSPGRGHYFVCRKDLMHRPEMQLLSEWLLNETAVFRGEASSLKRAG